MVWSLHPEDQDPLRELGVSGEMARPAPDGISYSVNNSGPNKLDAYLLRSMTYDAVVDPETGATSATVTIRLQNTLTSADGLSRDVAGNEKGLPAGTNRMWLTVYSPLQLVTADVDGQPRALAPSAELGWNAYSVYLNIAPQTTTVLTVTLGGELDVTGGYGLTIRPQPLASANAVKINVRSPDGLVLAEALGSLDNPTRLPRVV
jgi:hypothetical protein